MFSTFRTAIRDLPDGDRLDPRAFDSLSIYRDGEIAVWYAPFDAVNTDARVVLVGVTPGPTQAELALPAARDAVLAGWDDDRILRTVKVHASFGGPMRRRLVRALDAVGLHDCLGIASCADLFGCASHLVHCTSCIRYPTFVFDTRRADWVPYTGSRPDICTDPRLQTFLNDWLAVELEATSDAVVIPLGSSSADALAAVPGMINPDRVVSGLPHPSPANGHYERVLREAVEPVRAHLRQYFKRS